MPYITARRRLRLSIAALTALAVAATAAPRMPARAADQPTRVALRLDPNARYSAAIHMTHVVTNDLNGIYKKLAGSKADPVTILEDRTVTLAAGPSDAVDVATVDVRRYGGAQTKDTSTVKRSTDYKGTISADGKRTPSDEPLVDPGDGALAELPDTPIAVGQSWTFSKRVHVERDLGEGSLTYTDTLERVDTRNGHQIAVIGVKGAGKADVASDLKAKGFNTSDIVLSGTAEFDLTDGLPGVQHYTAHAQWNTRVLWVHLGLIFDDTYDAAAWTREAR